MKLNLKKIFKNSSDRYIRFDGSQWGTKKLIRQLSRAESKLTALCALGFVGAVMAQQGSMDMATTKMYYNMSGYLIGVGINTKLNNRIYKTFEHLNYFQKPIDTDCRSLKPAELSLGENLTLKRSSENGKNSSKSQFGVSIISLSVIPLVELIPLPILSSFLTGFIGLAVTTAIHNYVAGNRCEKLLKGHSGDKNGWIFVDDDPDAFQKSKKSIFSAIGKLNPT